MARRTERFVEVEFSDGIPTKIKVESKAGILHVWVKSKGKVTGAGPSTKMMHVMVHPNGLVEVNSWNPVIVRPWNPVIVHPRAANTVTIEEER